MDTHDTIRKLSIHTVIWDIFKWIPELLEDESAVLPNARALLKANYELFKNSAMTPVFEHTRLDQMHLLGSAVWTELTMLTNFLYLLCDLAAEDCENNPFAAWCDRHFVIAETEICGYTQIGLVATEMVSELNQMEVWS